MDPPLENFRRRADTKGHSLPPVSPKGGVESGQEGGVLFQLYVPEALADVEDSEDFGTVEACCDVLYGGEWVVFPADGPV